MLLYYYLSVLKMKHCKLRDITFEQNLTINNILYTRLFQVKVHEKYFIQSRHIKQIIKKNIADFFFQTNLPTAGTRPRSSRRSRIAAGYRPTRTAAASRWSSTPRRAAGTTRKNSPTWDCLWSARCTPPSGRTCSFPSAPRRIFWSWEKELRCRKCSKLFDRNQ